jgi:uncharacterized membrane-anchored protein
MKTLPKINASYWLCLIVAGILGTNIADFLSDYLHLGLMDRLSLFAVLLAAIFLAEKIRSAAGCLYFWAAIITVFTGATSIGDVFHDFGIHFDISLPLVGLLFAASVLGYKRLTTTEQKDGSFVIVTSAYWVCMVLAGILGTNGGDFASFGLRLMPLGAALACGCIVAALLYWGRKGRVVHPIYYWVLLAMIKTMGTAAGDFLAHDVFGLPLGTMITGVIFAGLVVYFYEIKLS